MNYTKHITHDCILNAQFKVSLEFSEWLVKFISKLTELI